jgi:hypothetical protein
MVAGMALMESPAIIAGLILVGLGLKNSKEDSDNSVQTNIKSILHEAPSLMAQFFY